MCSGTKITKTEQKKYTPIKKHRKYSVKFKACHIRTEKLFQCKETNNETRYFQASCISNKNWRPIENNHALNDHAILQYDKENFEFFFCLTTSLAKLRESMKNMFFFTIEFIIEVCSTYTFVGRRNEDWHLLENY